MDTNTRNPITIDNDAAPVVKPWQVNTHAGTHNTRVSSQWYSRPADEKFLDLNSLRAAVAAAGESSHAAIINANEVRVVGRTDEPDALGLMLPETADMVRPNHWSFGQLCSLVSVPAGYLRKLPGAIAGINLQYALANFRAESIKSYVRINGDVELRAITGPEYGRVLDVELVDAIQKIAGNGTGDTSWKVPGVLDWSSHTYNPHAPITKESTTLFASDRDVFIFLVDDTHPIEIGKLPDGSPDLIFRGFYAWNSEVGSKTLGIATFYLRAVCANRILWGVEGHQEFTLRHSKNAPMRFVEEAAPALASFASASTGRLLAGINDARRTVLAESDEKRVEVLNKVGLSRAAAKSVIETVLREEGRPACSVWDFVQGITAVARNEGRTDERLAMERIASGMLNKVTRS